MTVLGERKLTDGELKKRDEIVKAIKRDRKEENLTDEEIYAIATAQAKKTNERVIMDPYDRLQCIKESTELEKAKSAFESRYGIKADLQNLRQAASAEMRRSKTKISSRRAAMAKQLLDMMKANVDDKEIK